MNSQRVVGVIPARWGSTRFPGKMLAELCGKPLVQWVFERASQARSLDSLVVATDDSRIQQAVEAFGGRVVMTRDDHPSGTDRVAEACDGLDAQVVINIQGDEPLIDPVLIDSLADTMIRETGWDMATAAVPITDPVDVGDSSVVKVVCAGDGTALFFSRSAIPFDRDKSYTCEDGLYLRHLGIYAYRREFLTTLVAEPPCLLERAERLEQLRALHLGGRIKVVETAFSGIGVDTPDDVPRAETAIKELMES